MEGAQQEFTSAVETARVRLFVGGLGETVTSDDLRKIFASLGVIESMEIIRSKGRSFAYVDFLPSSHNSLSKLLSTYNGCLWKGGKLRLQKAKEHYLTRLRREWDEDAELANTAPAAPNIEVDPEKKMDPAEKALQKRSSEHKQLRMFFPKLGKVKSIPFNGTGKHKYSFRRVEVPPLPNYFCDCEEHCCPRAVEEEQMPTKEEHGVGMNKEELNIMNSVMNKLFQREGVSETVMDEVKPAFEENKSISSTDNLKFDETEAESTEEEDNIVINIVRGPKTVMDTQKSRFNKNEVSKSGPKKVLQSKRQTAPPEKKLSGLHEEENRGNEFESAIGGEKETTRGRSHGQGALLGSQSLEPNTGREESASNISWSQKSSWRELLGDSSKSVFNISKVFPGISSSIKEPPSDFVPHSGSSKKNLLGHEDQKFQQDKTGELKEKPISDVVPQSSGTEKNSAFGHEYRQLDQEKTDTIKKKSASDRVSGSGSENNELKHEDNEGQEGKIGVEEPAKAPASISDLPFNNPGRGSSWLQKSSWTQLVGGSNVTSFSITQVLPGVSFGKPEAAKPDTGKVANFTDMKHDDVAEGHNTKPIVNDSLDLGVAKEDDDHDTQITQNVPQQVAEASAPVVEEKRDKEIRETCISGITVGETCLFMRNATSRKEWANAKAALSGPRKRKNNET